MIPFKILVVTVFLTVIMFSCRKQEVEIPLADKLVGYYTGTAVHTDTIVNAGSNSQLRVQRNIFAKVHVLKQEKELLALQFSAEIKSSMDGNIFLGSDSFNGYIGDVRLQKRSLIITDCNLDFFEETLKIEGNGTYDEAKKMINLNLMLNYKNKKIPIVFPLSRVKRVDD